MMGKGSAQFIAAGFGSLYVEMKMGGDDTKLWKFNGAFIAPTALFGQCLVVGNFPGFDHMEGQCWFTLFDVTVGGGEFQVTWRDWQGEIGTAAGVGIGLGLGICLGTGSWSPPA